MAGKLANPSLFWKICEIIQKHTEKDAVPEDTAEKIFRALGKSPYIEPEKN